MTTASYSGGHPPKGRGGLLLATTGLFFPAGGGLWEAEKQEGRWVCRPLCFFFFQGGSNKTIKSLGSGVLFTPTPLRSIVKEGAM